MTMQKQIQEETPVTTTDNAGAGLDSPKLPIKQGNILRRYKDLKQQSENSKKLNKTIKPD